MLSIKVSTSASILLAAIFIQPGPSAAATPSQTPIVATSSLGDVTPFRTIAADTLKIVRSGDLMAARARIKDLETAWDRAEPNLKPRDKATWTSLDKAIDAVLADLRTPNPQAAACEASLKALVDQFDVVKKAA